MRNSPVIVISGIGVAISEQYFRKKIISQKLIIIILTENKYEGQRKITHSS